MDLNFLSIQQCFSHVILLLKHILVLAKLLCFGHPPRLPLRSGSVGDVRGGVASWERKPGLSRNHHYCEDEAFSGFSRKKETVCTKINK